MISKLKDGFEVEINEKALNDWRFLTTLRKIDKGETGMIVDTAELLLGGEEQVEALAKHLEQDGVTPVDAMIAALGEIMESVNSAKNS